MKHDIISQVREAEEKAERIVQDAHSEADQILHDARRQAADQRQEILTHAKNDAKDRFERGAKAVEPEIVTIHQQSEGDIAADTLHAGTQLDAAVEHVVARFREQFEREQFEFVNNSKTNNLEMDT